MGRRHIVKVEDGSLQFDATGEKVMSVLDWRLASGRYVSLLAEHLLAGDDVLSRKHGGGTLRRSCDGSGAVISKSCELMTFACASSS